MFINIRNETLHRNINKNNTCLIMVPPPLLQSVLHHLFTIIAYYYSIQNAKNILCFLRGVQPFQKKGLGDHFNFKKGPIFHQNRDQFGKKVTTF